MHRFKIFLILLVGINYTSFSQTQWSLSDCIKYALEHNIQVKQQTLNTHVQKNVLKQSKLDLTPNLNASVSRNFSFGRRVDPFTNQFTEKTTTSDNFSINSQVTLFSGFQKINTIQKNKLDLKVALSDLEKLKNDLSLNIASAYLNVLFNMEVLETAQKQIEITQKQVDRTQKLVDAGSLAKGNLLEIKAQLSDEELQAVNYENQLSISLLNLKQMLELDTLKNFQIIRPQVSIENINLPNNAEQIYTYAQQNMPQILSARYRLQSLEKSLSIAKGSRSPQLNLGVGFGTGYSEARKIFEMESIRFIPDGGYATDGVNQYITYSPIPSGGYKTKSFADQIRDNQSTYAVLSLNIPIFNRWSVNTHIKNSKINILNARYTLDYEQKKLYKEIQQKYLDAVAAYKKFLATESSLKSAQESYNYTEQKFNVGMVNTLDYNLAKNRLTQIKSKLLQAKYQYIFSVKILDFYQGTDINL